ncbi:MAG: hypothetical protein KDD64_14030 [Bdellovibrionales bacterium]|nr:hypothetical protein [Bdellovibrionales bacterium]
MEKTHNGYEETFISEKSCFSGFCSEETLEEAFCFTKKGDNCKEGASSEEEGCSKKENYCEESYC